MSTTRNAKPSSDRVVHDFDALEKNGEPVPYVITYKGKEFTFADPWDQDWQTGRTIDPFDIPANLRELLGEAQYAEFEKVRMPIWKIQQLSARIQAHYAKYYGSPGEDSASSGS